MCNLDWCYTFCSSVTHFGLVLPFLYQRYTYFALVLHFLYQRYTYFALVSPFLYQRYTYFALVLPFLYQCTLVALVLHLSCTALSQSE